MKVRTCSVAGMFYPRDPHHLEQLVAGYLKAREPIEGIRGIVAPHAGYPYSGAVAGEAFSVMDPGFSGTFVVIGPSHRGYLTCASAIPRARAYNSRARRHAASLPGLPSRASASPRSA